MPWRCPACYTQIQRTVLDGDDRPRQGQHYRCHVCRLELVMNERTNALDVVPLEFGAMIPRMLAFFGFLIGDADAGFGARFGGSGGGLPGSGACEASSSLASFCQWANAGRV